MVPRARTPGRRGSCRSLRDCCWAPSARRRRHSPGSAQRSRLRQPDLHLRPHPARIGARVRPRGRKRHVDRPGLAGLHHGPARHRDLPGGRHQLATATPRSWPTAATSTRVSWRVRARARRAPRCSADRHRRTTSTVTARSTPPTTRPTRASRTRTATAYATPRTSSCRFRTGSTTTETAGCGRRPTPATRRGRELSPGTDSGPRSSAGQVGRSM